MTSVKQVLASIISTQQEILMRQPHPPVISGFLNDKTLYHVNEMVYITGDFDQNRVFTSIFSSGDMDETSTAKPVTKNDQTVLEVRIPRELSAGTCDVFIDAGDIIKVGEITIHDRMTPNKPLVVNALSGTPISFQIPHSTLSGSIADLVSVETRCDIDGVLCESFVNVRFVQLEMSIPEIQAMTSGEIHVTLTDSEGFSAVFSIQLIILTGNFNTFVNTEASDIAMRTGTKTYVIGDRVDGTTIHGLSNFPLDIKSRVKTNDVVAQLSHDGSISLKGTGVAMGNIGDSQEFTILPFLPQIEQIVAGDNHFIALARDGSIYVWGDNSNLQCSPDAEEHVTIPLKLPGTFGSVHAIGNYSFAVSTMTVLYGWGTGVGAFGLQSSTPEIEHKFMKVLFPHGVFYYHFTETSLYVLVRMDFSTTVQSIKREVHRTSGTENILSSNVLTFSDPAMTFDMVGGKSHVIVRCDDQLFTFGSNNNGQLGTGVSDENLFPLQEHVRELQFPGESIIDIYAGDDFSAVKTDKNVYIFGKYGENVHRTPAPLRKLLQSPIADGNTKKSVSGIEVSFPMSNIPRLITASHPLDSDNREVTHQDITGFSTNGRMVAFAMEKYYVSGYGSIGLVRIYDTFLNTTHDVTINESVLDLSSIPRRFARGVPNKSSLYITNDHLFVASPNARPDGYTEGYPGVVDHFKRELLADGSFEWRHVNAFHHALDENAPIALKTQGYGENIIFDEVRDKLFITNSIHNMYGGLLDEWIVDKSACIQHSPSGPVEYRFFGVHARVLNTENTRFLLASAPTTGNGTIWMNAMDHAGGSEGISTENGWTAIFKASDYSELNEYNNIGYVFTAWMSGTKIKVLASSCIADGIYIAQTVSGKPKLVYFEYDTTSGTTTPPSLITPPPILTPSNWESFGYFIEYVNNEHVVVCDNGETKNLLIYRPNTSGNFEFAYDIPIDHYPMSIKCVGDTIFSLDRDNRVVKSYGLLGSRA